MFKDFIKKVGIMLIMLCLIIACVGAITTKDVVFTPCGIVALVVLAREIYLFIKDNSGNQNK